MATALDANGERVTPTIYPASLDSTDVSPWRRCTQDDLFAARVPALRAGRRAVCPALRRRGLRLSGEPTRIADGVSYYRTSAPAHFDVSSNGVLAYRGSGEQFRARLVDRRGSVDRHGMGDPVLRPHADFAGWPRVAVDVIDPRIGTSDIWIYEVSGGAPVRFTSDLTTRGGGVVAGRTTAGVRDRTLRRAGAVCEDASEGPKKR